MVQEESNHRIANDAGVSLRRMLGADSLEPDYVFMLARHHPPEDDTLERLRVRGDAARMLQALADPKCKPGFIEPLVLALASRDPLPVDAAAQYLGDPRPRGGAIAARIIGRATVLSADHQAELERAAGHALDDWEDRRRRDQPLTEASDRVRWMLWAAAQQGVGGPFVARALDLDGVGSEELHAFAAEALTLLEAPEQLVRVMRTGHAMARSLAAGTLAAKYPERAAEVVGGVLDDRAAAEPLLTAGLRPAELTTSAAQVHLQGVALPYLVAAADVAALRAALASDLEDVRLGAVEALGAVGSEEGEDALRSFALDDEREEDERKAAWRALRRSKRSRQNEEAVR